jgi:ATP-dependent RNA helicase DDX56/DBP9
MADEADELPQQWSDMQLDSRIVEAVRELRWPKPTTVQSACIPQALKGRDVSIQSRTGSGKTGAFAVPLLQRIIRERLRVGGSSKAAACAVGLVLVPSVELAEQIAEVLGSLAKFIKPRVVVDNLTLKGAVTNDRVLAADVVVTTAALLGKHVRSGVVSMKAFEGLRMLVVDEADMVLAISERSMRTVQSALPQTLQCIMCSATLTEGVASLKGLLLHHPTNITLTNDDDDTPGAAAKSSKASRAAAADDDASSPIVETHVKLKDPTAQTLKQYYVVATDEYHAHTILFSLFRLNLLHGKTLLFVDEEPETYMLQHFLEQLGIASVVYDTSLPVNVRLDMIRRFQRGDVATLICTDRTLESMERLDAGPEDEGEQCDEVGAPRKTRRTEKGKTVDPNSALHRGIDFSRVSNVIIFNGLDKPTNVNFARYTHRIGRCGRAGQPGMSILLLSAPQATHNMQALRTYVKSRDETIRPFKQLVRTEAAKLQYRVDSVLHNVTRNATKKLRVATVASELARSSYLSTHMSEKDTDALRRIVKKSSRTVRCDSNLLDLPQYLQLKNVDSVDQYTERVNATHQSKREEFAKASRPKTVDPLKAVVASVRGTERAAAKKKRIASKGKK